MSTVDSLVFNRSSSPGLSIMQPNKLRWLVIVQIMKCFVIRVQRYAVQKGEVSEGGYF